MDIINFIIIIIYCCNILNIKIPITHRSHKLYLKYLFPDKKNINCNSKYFNNKLILDIGCGNNIFYNESFIFKIIKNNNSDIYGVDPYINNDNFSSLSYNFLKKKPNNYSIYKNHLLNFYADSLPFPNNSVNIILSLWLLGTWIQEEKELMKIFKEFQRVLVINGVVRIYPICSLRNLNYEK